PPPPPPPGCFFSPVYLSIPTYLPLPLLYHSPPCLQDYLESWDPELKEGEKEEPAMVSPTQKDNPLFVDPNSSVSNPRHRTPRRPTS
ncbi:MAG: hypothetical protein MJE68_08985, partial [Proteobacteria bacterium]|nr:hypothetical protein [Pseudomonadota bacterium]